MLFTNLAFYLESIVFYIKLVIDTYSLILSVAGFFRNKILRYSQVCGIDTLGYTEQTTKESKTALSFKDLIAAVELPQKFIQQQTIPQSQNEAILV